MVWALPYLCSLTGSNSCIIIHAYHTGKDHVKWTTKTNLFCKLNDIKLTHLEIILKEFKQFIAKGNVLELAVGLIMAVYFGAIVKSLVDHIIMPPIGKTGSVDHPSPEWDRLCKRQNTNTFILSTEIGVVWSGGPFFPQKYQEILESELERLNPE